MALGYRSRSKNLTGATGRWGASLPIDCPSGLVWLIPFAVATVYLVVFVAQLPHNLWVLWWNSDYTSGFTVPEAIVRTGTGGNTVLGTTGGYIQLWFGLLTANLPLHRELWEIGPTVVFIATALTVGWSVAQVANRRVAVFAALLIIVASPRALYIFMAPVSHNTVVYPCTALLGAYLIWLARRTGRRRATLLVVALLAGVVLGTCIASDSLVLATGVIPFTITALLMGLQRGRHPKWMAACALSTVVIAIPIAKLTSSIMGSLGYVTIAPSTVLASLSTLPQHAELMWEGLKGLMNGYLSQTTPSGLHPVLGVACEVIMVAALTTLLIVGVRTTVQFIWSGLRRDYRTTPTQLATSLHIIYWAGSAATISIAWALSIRIEYVHESYYATLVLSVAAVVALLMRSRAPTRWLVSACASIFFLASIVGLTSHYMESYVLPIARSYMVKAFVPPIAHYMSDITGFAKANHVVVGYAGYGDASDLTWSSHERVVVRPVQVCRNPGGVDICPFFLERVPSWYEPKRRRTFLLVDTTETFLPALPEGLGEPLAMGTFGPVQMYVYSYDIASLIAPLST
jgi:hypothetical protein